MSKGVMTGCDSRQEWMLKWWWENYSKTNSYPVTFCDFGMTPAARAYCKTKGEVIDPPEPLPLSTEASASTPWAKNLPNCVWRRRPVWFTKALVLKQTPYEETIWTDLDCEIQASLTPLYEMAYCPAGFTIAYDKKYTDNNWEAFGALQKGVRGIQVGVIAFKKDSPLLADWLKRCKTHCHVEYSEQTALSHLLHEKNYDLTYFSNRYNWVEDSLKHQSAAIIHHAGPLQKWELFKRMRFR